MIQSRDRAAKAPKIIPIYNPPTLINSVQPWHFQEVIFLKSVGQNSNRIICSAALTLLLNILFHSNTKKLQAGENPEFENLHLLANSWLRPFSTCFSAKSSSDSLKSNLWNPTVEFGSVSMFGSHICPVCQWQDLHVRKYFPRTNRETF